MTTELNETNLSSLKTILKVDKITKEFPGVLANNNVSIQINAGEIISVLGENGAGKSTLMKILSGLYRPDFGQILVNKEWFQSANYQPKTDDNLESVQFKNPNDALHLGIGMVHQHFQLVETMTVVDNITLGKEFIKPSRIFISIIDEETSNSKIKELSKRYGLEIDPMSIIEDLPVGLKQRVEILKQLFRDAKLLIFDEPTAVLTPTEVEELFKTMNQLKKSGKTIIFISHKLKEALTISDRIIVMRNGEVVGETDPKKATQESLAEMMVGRRVLLRLTRKEIHPGVDVLAVNNFSVIDKNNRQVVKNLSFKCREFEIVGVAGVQGNGQTELLDGIMALTKGVSGSVKYYDAQNPKGFEFVGESTLSILEKGIAYIPEDRSIQGLINEFQLTENSWLGFMTQPVRAKAYIGDIDQKNLDDKKLIIDRKNKYFLPLKLIENFASKIVKDLEVATPTIKTAIKNLSGGNQQKVILGREFAKNPRLIIASQPTRGVDVGVTERVRNALIDMRNDGSSVFLISSDLDEVLNLSDYLLVMYEGKIVGEGNIEDFTIEELSKLMTTGKK